MKNARILFKNLQNIQIVLDWIQAIIIIKNTNHDFRVCVYVCVGFLCIDMFINWFAFAAFWLLKNLATDILKFFNYYFSALLSSHTYLKKGSIEVLSMNNKSKSNNRCCLP